MPLKFPKRFIKWFNDIGPSVNLFLQQVKDNYQYFNEKTTFVQGYRFISFVASQGITWIMSWDYDMIQDLIKLSNETDTQYLARSIQVKWWNKFDILFVRKEKIDEWVKMSQQKV